MKLSRSVGVLAVGAMLAFGASAHATTYTEDVTIDNSSPFCGSTTMVDYCVSSTLFAAPITADVGDVIDLTITLTQRQYVPAASLSALETAGAFDATYGLGSAYYPPIYKANYTNTIIGYQGPPLTASFSGTVGFGSGYASYNGFYLTPSTGFSYTGVHTVLDILTADPNPLYGATVGYNIADAAPEPATWALMMFGVAALGTMLRRRHRVFARDGQRCVASA